MNMEPLDDASQVLEVNIVLIKEEVYRRDGDAGGDTACATLMAYTCLSTDTSWLIVLWERTRYSRV